MKRVLANVIVVCMILQLGVILQAEELTLDNCIEKALQNRYSIIASRGYEQLARADKRAALGAFLPALSASYDYSKTERTDIKSEVDLAGMGKTELTFPDQDLTNKYFSLGGQIALVNIPNWFSYARARADVASAELDVLSSEQDLIYSVRMFYYAYLSSLENVSVQEEAVKRSEEQLKLMQSKFELGSAALSDVLKQKVQFGNDRLTLLSAQNAATTTKADLCFVIGIDPNQNIEFATSVSSRAYDGSLQEAVELGLSSNPSLLSSQKKMDATGHNMKAAWATYLPTVSAYGRKSWSDGTQGDTVTYNSSSQSFTYGIGVGFNIFDRFYRERQMSQAKISRNNARAALADKRNEVTVEIKKAYLDIDKAVAQKDVSQENVDAADEDMKISQEKYNLGAATILDLLTAQESLKSAHMQLIRAGFDLNLAVAKLERAMGKR